MIQPKQIRAIVKAEGKLVDVPMSCNMHELGLSNDQLKSIQRRCLRMFNRTVSIIYFSDTIYDITDRINKKAEKEKA